MPQRSSRPEAANVKPSKLASLLSGWQAGVVVVVFALIATIVAVPRPVLPDDLPMPVIRSRILGTITQQELDRASQAARIELPYEVRAVGEALRAYGALDAQHSPEGAQALTVIHDRVATARKHGPEPLLQLRGYQMKIFLDELHAFEQTGEESPQLRELCGGLVDMASRAGWLERRGQRFKFIADTNVRQVLFRKRWGDLTGLQQGPFALDLEEHRSFYQFLLEHPSAEPRQSNARDRCHAQNEYLLRKVNELASVDSEYPAQYARGILFLRLNRPKEAVQVLANHVERHPDGPYTLRARNTLREAQERLMVQIVP